MVYDKAEFPLDAGPKRKSGTRPFDKLRDQLTASGVKNLVPQAHGISLGTDLVCELVLLFLFFQRKERQGKRWRNITILSTIKKSLYLEYGISILIFL